jgi:hypothetical protein
MLMNERIFLDRSVGHLPTLPELGPDEPGTAPARTRRSPPTPTVPAELADLSPTSSPASSTSSPTMRMKGRRPSSVKSFASAKSETNINVREEFDKLNGSGTSRFKDWFHSMSHTFTMLSNRPDVPAADKEKLLKFELMRYQLQSTYVGADSDRLERQTSPLVLHGYGRGTKTGLWEMSRKISKTKVQQGLEAAVAARGRLVRTKSSGTMAALNMDAMSMPGHPRLQRSMTTLDGINKSRNPAPAPVDQEAVLDARFNVFPASHPFEAMDKVPTVFDEVPADLNKFECVYIKSLGVQLVKSATVKAKADDSGQIHRYMGGHGLRTSPGVLAETCARELVQLLDTDSGAARKLLTDVMKDVRRSPETNVVRKAFEKVNLNVDTMIAPLRVDPMTHSTQRETLAFQASYFKFLRHGKLQPGELEPLPFVVQENVAIVRNLVAKSGLNKFDGNMPAPVCGALTDALDSAGETIQKLRRVNPQTPEAAETTSQLIEKLYQELQNIHHTARFMGDWVGQGDPTAKLDSAVKNLLPENVRAETKVFAAPHALSALFQIRASLPPAKLHDAAILRGAYYEIPELFPHAKEVTGIGDASLQSKNLILMEPHPNNAALDHIDPHDPVQLLENIFSNDRKEPCTVIMDVTLNHLSDEQIKLTLEKAKPYIDDGRLNLILLQSGTKFMQSGMDLTNIGVSAVINKGPGWADFNQKMEQRQQPVAREDVRYIANMLDGNGPELKRYMDRVRDNTSTLRTLLEQKVGSEPAGAFELCGSTDPETVYIAIKPKDAHIAKVLNKQEHELTDDDRVKVAHDMYVDQFLPAFDDLAVVDRTSFGFNNTNFGECGKTFRITLGIEEKEMLNLYAQKIAEVSRAAAA